MPVPARQTKCNVHAEAEGVGVGAAESACIEDVGAHAVDQLQCTRGRRMSVLARWIGRNVLAEEEDIGASVADRLKKKTLDVSVAV